VIRKLNPDAFVTIDSVSAANVSSIRATSLRK
jgi:hypothetical protein